MHNGKKDAPSFHRNIEPITERLKSLFGDQPLNVLEIGSGSGQHVTSLAKTFPKSTFYPTDFDPENIASINAWARSDNLVNVKEANVLDVTQPEPQALPDHPVDAILCFNVIHISPWEVTEALFTLAAQVTAKEASVILYGPYRINGEHTAESNVAFEGWLKAQDERFGVRSMEDVEAEAQANGFSLNTRHEMPANNFLLVFKRS